MSDDKPWASKWCPMVRNDFAKISLSEESDRNPEWARCIGPECMMFRATFNVLVEFQRPNGRVDKDLVPTVGYCGLAGRP